MDDIVPCLDSSSKDNSLIRSSCSITSRSIAETTASEFLPRHHSSAHHTSDVITFAPNHDQSIHVCLQQIPITVAIKSSLRPRTGATGYIGGDALATLTQRHPEFTYSALVRSSEKADQVKAQYPNIRIVLGDLDNSQLLERESAAADIVLREGSQTYLHHVPLGID